MQNFESGDARSLSWVQGILAGELEGGLLTRVNREPAFDQGTLTLREPHDDSHETIGILTCRKASLLKKLQWCHDSSDDPQTLDSLPQDGHGIDNVKLQLMYMSSRAFTFDT